MQGFQEYLKGKKTYIVAALLVLVSLVEFLSGDIPLGEFLSGADLLVLLNGLGLATLRAGIK